MPVGCRFGSKLVRFSSFFLLLLFSLKKKEKRELTLSVGGREKKYISVPPYIWLYIPSSAVSDINDEYPLVAFRLFPPLSLTHFPSRLSVRLFFFFHRKLLWARMMMGPSFLYQRPSFWFLTLLFSKEPDRFGSFT